MNFPIILEESCYTDIKRWVEGGGSTQVTHPRTGFTLLHFASDFQCVAAVEYLIGLGMDPNILDSNGQSPLHVAVDSEIDSTVQTGGPLLYETTKRLLELGADLYLKDRKGESPLDWINGYGEKARRRFNEIMNTAETTR
jgi:ankyrin repeat protein